MRVRHVDQIVHVDQLVAVSRGQAMKGMRHLQVPIEQRPSHPIDARAASPDQTAEQFQLGRSTGRYGSFSE